MSYVLGFPWQESLYNHTALVDIIKLALRNFVIVRGRACLSVHCHSLARDSAK